MKEIHGNYRHRHIHFLTFFNFLLLIKKPYEKIFRRRKLSLIILKTESEISKNYPTSIFLAAHRNKCTLKFFKQSISHILPIKQKEKNAGIVD